MSRNAKNITAQVIGGEPQVFDNDLQTVQDAYDALGLEGSYAATVNGEPADMDQELEDFEFVTFSPAVKGGC